jgi:hypothetical protein
MRRGGTLTLTLLSAQRCGGRRLRILNQDKGAVGSAGQAAKATAKLAAGEVV